MFGLTAKVVLEIFGYTVIIGAVIRLYFLFFNGDIYIDINYTKLSPETLAFLHIEFTEKSCSKFGDHWYVIHKVNGPYWKLRRLSKKEMMVFNILDQ
jgi:hypothetical protein